VPKTIFGNKNTTTEAKALLNLNGLRGPQRAALPQERPLVESKGYSGPPMVYPIEAPTRTTLLELKTSLLFMMW
jgi:hypothetical protein